MQAAGLAPTDTRGTKDPPAEMAGMETNVPMADGGAAGGTGGPTEEKDEEDDEPELPPPHLIFRRWLHGHSRSWLSRPSPRKAQTFQATDRHQQIASYLESMETTLTKTPVPIYKVEWRMMRFGRRLGDNWLSYHQIPTLYRQVKRQSSS